MTVKVGDLTPNDKGWPCGFAHVTVAPEAPFLVTLNGWENAVCREHAAQLHPKLFPGMAPEDVILASETHTLRRYTGTYDCGVCNDGRPAAYTVELNGHQGETLIPCTLLCGVHLAEGFPALVPEFMAAYERPPVVESREPADWGDVDFLAYDPDKSWLMICPTMAKYRSGHPNVMLTCGKDTMDAEKIYNAYRETYPNKYGPLGNTWWRDRTLNVWRCEILPAT